MSVNPLQQTPSSSTTQTSDLSSEGLSRTEQKVDVMNILLNSPAAATSNLFSSSNNCIIPLGKAPTMIDQRRSSLPLFSSLSMAQSSVTPPPSVGHIKIEKKRKRSGGTACMECRKSHKKCSMEKPCFRCQQLGVACVSPASTSCSSTAHLARRNSRSSPTFVSQVRSNADSAASDNQNQSQPPMSHWTSKRRYSANWATLPHHNTAKAVSSSTTTSNSSSEQQSKNSLSISRLLCPSRPLIQQQQPTLLGPSMPTVASVPSSSSSSPSPPPPPGQQQQHIDYRESNRVILAPFLLNDGKDSSPQPSNQAESQFSSLVQQHHHNNNQNVTTTSQAKEFPKSSIITRLPSITALHLL